MQAILPTLDQMLFLVLCILIGWTISKLKLLPENADQALSRFLNYAVLPALIFHSFYNNCTLENLSSNGPTVLYSMLYYGICLVLAIFVGPLFSKDPANQGLYKYSMMITNFGFMGNALILGLFGDSKLFQYMIFGIPGSILVYSIGVVWLTGGKRKLSWRSFANPMFAFMILGILLGILHPPLPAFVTKTMSSLGSCFSPVAMVLTGVVIAKFNLGQLLKVRPVYALSIVRLILIPVAVFFLFKAIGAPEEILLLTVFSAAMPLGMNTIVFPAAYGGDMTTGAGMAVISNIIGLITVPLILSLVI